jgi:Predicted membrane protein
VLPGRPEDRSPGAAALPEDPEDLYPGTAAERTRLAWARTAIAFGAVGLAMLRGEPSPACWCSRLPR